MDTVAGLAQSVERQALNLMVEGSSPSFGVSLFLAAYSIEPFCIRRRLPQRSSLWIQLIDFSAIQMIKAVQLKSAER